MPRNLLVVVTGVPAIDRRLKRLEPNVQRKVARKAIREGLRPVAAEMKAQAPSETGATRRGVKIRALKGRKRGEIRLEVRILADLFAGTLKVAASTGQKAFIPAIVQYGRKGVAPNAFASRAYALRAEDARDIAMDRLLIGTLAEASAR